MLLFVYTTAHKSFVIFTRGYFKLNWNTISLSQSDCRNFSFSSKNGDLDACSVANIPRGVLGTRVNPDTGRIRVDGKIGHFRVPPGLNSIKTRLNAWPLIWKWFFILMQIKPIFTRKVVHFWKWGILELGSDLFELNTVTCGNPETKSCGFTNIWIRVVGALGSSFTQFSCTWQKYPQQVALILNHFHLTSFYKSAHLGEKGEVDNNL